MVACIPPGNRTGSAAAIRVIPVQKMSRTKSTWSGRGIETRTRMRKAADMTG